MDILGAYFQPRTNLAGFLIPDVVVNELHTDTLQIASHPVEFGPDISDHAWKQPSELNIDCFFRAGGSFVDFANTTAFNLGIGSSPAQIYQQLLDLQAKAEPFRVMTRRRSYSNMLLKTITVTTAGKSENVLGCKLVLSEVSMTATEALPAAGKNEMEKGVTTASVGNKGEKVVTTPMGSGKITPVPPSASK
ncbi:phage baseplate protein [Cedecea davisae]|uniref:phage baseplate protein n=1 Tax=Cedecea davisae TaxID=158484 RepID=UPI00376EC2B4